MGSFFSRDDTVQPPPPPPTPVTLTDKNVYQVIWDADQKGNGIRAILPSDDRPAQGGFVVVNEANFKEDGSTNVFTEVTIPTTQKDTYDKFTALVDNYFIDSNEDEEQNRNDQTKEDIKKEVNNFVESVYDTQPMKIARRYYDEEQSDEDWKDLIKQLWFENVGNDDRSGFEHVFVGENSGGKNNIGGYHFWYKYYIDDSENNINGEDTIEYVGPAYGNSSKNREGQKVPEVVTLTFDWNPTDKEKKVSFELNKPRGGFWVGCSPEGLMALGMARFKSDAAMNTVINGVEYDLILSTRDSGNTTIINTFFPIFKSIKEDIDEEETETVRIISALVNPDPEPDKGNEKVTVKNFSSVTVDITNWKIEDKVERAFEIKSNVKLLPGDMETITLEADSAQLGNNDGKITLKDNDEKVIDQVSYTKRDIVKDQDGNGIVQF